MIYNLSHSTKYQYASAVSLCHNLVHLRPRIAPRQTCHQSQMLVQPEPRALQNQFDYFGNPISLFTIQEPHRRLSITVKHRIEVTPSEPIRVQESPGWEAVRDALRTDRSPALLEACQFTFDSSFVPRNAELAAYAEPSFAPGRPLLEAALDLTARIHKDFRYDAKATTLSTPLHEVLEHRRGVCQDFAHLQIGCLRSIGLAARYVSGYLQTRAPAGRERLVGADASHAWVAAYTPVHGWVEFDPTNDHRADQRYITLAWGTDFADVVPLRGVILGGRGQSMAVEVSVIPA